MPNLGNLNEENDLIPTAEVAKLLGCNYRTVHRKVDSGELVPALKFPGPTGGYLFRRSDIQPADADAA